MLGGVLSSQAWGLGSTEAGARFKGGWGPGTDRRYLVRQMGVLDPAEGHQLVVAAAVIPNDGSFASGTAMLDRVAAWLVDHAGSLARGAAGC
jgi:hypothetical protein